MHFKKIIGHSFENLAPFHVFLNPSNIYISVLIQEVKYVPRFERTNEYTDWFLCDLVLK